MAQQTINNGESGLDVRTKLNDNFTELYEQGWQGAWAFPGDALPTSWPVGARGYASADRSTIGHPTVEYVPAGSLIFRVTSGTAYSDFRFI